MVGSSRDLNRESVQGGYFGYASNELLHAFDGLRVLSYEDRSDDADWGRTAPGEKPIVRFLARKPLEPVAGLRGAYLGQTLPGTSPELFAPDIVTFYGADQGGAKTQLVQHVSQLNVMLKATPKLTETPRRIGFEMRARLEAGEE